MLKVYNVVLYYEGNIKCEIEAHNDEEAETIAVDRLRFRDPDVDIVDAVVTLSDNQYTAEQECIDDDDRRPNKENGV